MGCFQTLPDCKVIRSQVDLFNHTTVSTGNSLPIQSIPFSPLLFPVQTESLWIWREHKQKRSGARSFCNAAPTLRNRLPDKFYQVKYMASFWRQLKSHLFSTMWSPHPPALIPSPLSSSYCQTFQSSESCAVSMWFSWMESDLALKVDRHWHLAFLHSRSQDNEVELYFSVLIVSTL